MGTSAGSIIATIITLHMPRNVAAAPDQLWPGIRIHAIDMVQPPGISMPGIADMDPHQTMVIAVLAANTSAAVPMRARSGRRVLVVTLPPDAGLVASERRAI